MGEASMFGGPGGEEAGEDWAALPGWPGMREGARRHRQRHHEEQAHHGRRHDRGGFGPGFGRGMGPWGMAGGPGGPFFGRGPKVARGDVRAAILVLLSEQPMHGYQMIQELIERSGGVWRPSPGSVYPTLQQLEDEGLVRREEVEGRRVFRLTDSGTEEVAKRGPNAPAPWDVSGGAGPLMDLRDVGFGVAAAVMQVAQTGTERQVARAREILAETRRQLYRVLAEDEPAPVDGPASN